MLRSYTEAQERERKEATNLWTESEYVFAKRLGGRSVRTPTTTTGSGSLKTPASGTAGCTTLATPPAPY